MYFVSAKKKIYSQQLKAVVLTGFFSIIYSKIWPNDT